MSKFRLYTDWTDLDLNKKSRKSLFPLVRAHVSTSTRYKNLKEKNKLFIKWVNSPFEADFAILPHSWNYYLKRNKAEFIKKFVEKCRKAQITILSVNLSDRGVKVPKIFNDVIVLRQGGFRSKFQPNEIAMPVFMKDPWNTSKQYQSVPPLPYSQLPCVGFCGHSSISFKKILSELHNKAFKNIFSYLRLIKSEPDTFGSPTWMRSRVLSSLEKDSRIRTKFIKRNEKLALKPINKVNKNEFLENIANTHYTVCVRGAGNFSVRFYETMAMGRIPLLLDTDSPLPVFSFASWEKLIPIENKIHQLSGTLLNFHSKHEKHFQEIQHEIRLIWESKFSMTGYFKTQLAKWLDHPIA